MFQQLGEQEHILSDSNSPGGKTRAWVMVGLCGAVLALLYVALNTSFSFRFEERRGVQNYGMLRDALL